MESFFGVIGFLVAVICFAIGASVVLYGAFDAVKFVQKRLQEAVTR